MAPKGGAQTQKKLGPEGWLPKFRSFFRLPPPFRSFCLSLCVFLLNFGGVCEDRDPQMCTFGLSGCRVKPRRLRGRRGFTQQPENPKREHLTAPALPNTTKKPREDPKEANVT